MNRQTGELFRLTGVPFRLTEAPFRLTGVPFKLTGMLFGITRVLFMLTGELLKRFDCRSLNSHVVNDYKLLTHTHPSAVLDTGKWRKQTLMLADCWSIFTRDKMFLGICKMFFFGFWDNSFFSHFVSAKIWGFLCALNLEH